jgi:CRP-like cAMP-binding protein
VPERPAATEQDQFPPPLPADRSSSASRPARSPFQTSLAEALDPRDSIRLYGNADRRSYRGRDLTVFHEGDACDRMYEVISGLVRLARTAPDGQRQVVRYIPAGGLFDLVPVFDGGPHVVTATTVEPTELLRIPRDDVLRVVGDSPAAGGMLARMLAAQLRDTVGLVGDLALYHVPARVARILLQEIDPRAGIGVGFPAAATRRELAENAGTSREVVGRFLRALEASGIVRADDGRIEILDADRLRNVAEYR